MREKGMSEKKNTAAEDISFRPIRLQEYRSPDKLNEYVRISRPSTWVAIVALNLIILALFIWGITGTLPVHCVTRGVCVSRDDNEKITTVVCLVDPVKATAADLQNKDAFVVLRSGQSVSGKTSLPEPFPQSLEQIRENLADYGVKNEWIFSQLEQYPFMYFLMVDLDSRPDSAYYGELAEVSVITAEFPPYKFLIGGEI